MAAASSSGGDATPADAPSAVEYFARGVETPQSLQTPAARADTPTIRSGMPLPPPSTPSGSHPPHQPNVPGATRPVGAVNPPRWPDAGGASARTDRTERVERRGMSGALAALAVALAALALVVAACGTLGRLGVVSVLVRTDTPPAFTTPASGAPLPGATTASASPSPGARSTPPTVPSVTASANATAAGTPSPAPTGAPTATAPASPTGTPVPSDGPSTLSIDRSSFSFKLCSGLTPKATQFTVKNSGGGTLDWTATTAAGYTISPSSGTLAAGAFVMVDVTKIAASGQITVTAPGASGSPGFVSITCTVL